MNLILEDLELAGVLPNLTEWQSLLGSRPSRRSSSDRIPPPDTLLKRSQRTRHGPFLSTVINGFIVIQNPHGRGNFERLREENGLFAQHISSALLTGFVRHVSMSVKCDTIITTVCQTTRRISVDVRTPLPDRPASFLAAMP